MKKINVLQLFMLCVLVTITSCSNDDSIDNLNDYETKTTSQSKAINLYDFSDVKINLESNIESKTSKNQVLIKENKIDFNYSYIKNDNQIIVFNEAEKTLYSVNSSGNEFFGVDKNDFITDKHVFLIMYNLAIGVYNKVDGSVPTTSDCEHVAVGYNYRKSVLSENLQELVDVYLADNPDCNQVGGVDTLCGIGDFGCVGIATISCPNGNDCD